MAEIIGSLLVLGTTFGVLALAYIWRGFVLSKVWTWLVVPVFHLEPITVIGAIIISVIVGFLTYQAPTNKTDPEKATMSHNLSVIFLYPLATLAIAWVIKFFI